MNFSVAPTGRKGLALTLILTLLVIVSQGAGAGSVDFDRQAVTIAMTQEPPNLNSVRTTDTVSFFLLGHMVEGLVRYGRRGQLVPGVARSWEVGPTHILFKLREDAKWSDGSAVTAHDFVYAWQRVNDPEEAAPFAAIMYPIKNAEMVQKGKLPVSALGVTAVSDFELAVEFERPCGYCLSLMPHATFFPIKQSFHEDRGARYGSEAEHLLSNGPFRLAQWTHEASLTLVRNQYYWNVEAIELSEIRVGYITADNRTRLNLFRDDQIAFTTLGSETVLDAVDQGMRLKTFLSGGVAYISFNVHEGRAMANKQLRQAIQASFDPDEFVNQVIAIPGYKPTDTLFPSWLKIDGKGIARPVAPVRDQARVNKLMKQARETLGEIPAQSLLTVASPTGAKVAEYLQGRLGTSLGLEVKVDQQTFKQYLSKTRQSDFDLVLSSWYPDFDDIVTYADLLGSYNANNRGGFVSADYDRWLRVLQISNVTETRLGAASELQKIIVDEVPVLPTAETGSAYLLHPKIRGVMRRVIGQDPDFTYARVLP